MPSVAPLSPSTKPNLMDSATAKNSTGKDPKPADTTGSITLRAMTEADVEAAAAICNKAFNAFNESVGLPPEFPPTEVVDVPLGLFKDAVNKSPDIQTFVALNAAGEVIGSNMVDLRDGVAGIGPISVQPGTQNAGAGRMLMQAVMNAAAEAGVESVRLVQISSNSKSFSLYLSLGFDPICTIGEYVAPEGCTAGAPSGFECAPIDESTVAACDALHQRIVGVARAKEIESLAAGPMPTCVVKDAASGEVVAFTTGSYVLGLTVSASEDALKALLVFQSKKVISIRNAGAPLPPVSVHVPHDRPAVARWLARNGFRLNRHATLMSYGPHPTVRADGIYLPSILY